MPKVEFIGTEAFRMSTITTVVTPLLTEAGYSVFWRAPALASVSMAKIQRLGVSVFEGCTALTSVSLPKVEQLSNSVFSGCTSLQTISLPEAWEIFNFAFEGCTSLVSADIPIARRFGVEIFRDCTSLTTVNMLELRGMENGAPYGGTAPSGMFYRCTALVSITLPEALVLDNFLFYGCTNLTTVNAPKATKIGGGTFGDCVNLTSLTLGDAAQGSVTAYSFMNTGKDTPNGFTIKVPNADIKSALETKIADSTQLGSSQLASTWYTALHDTRTDRFNQGKFKGVEVWE
jgi:hypothetical protein